MQNEKGDLLKKLLKPKGQEGDIGASIAIKATSIDRHAYSSW